MLMGIQSPGEAGGDEQHADVQDIEGVQLL